MKLPPLICSVILSKPSIGSKRATGNFHPCFARFLFASPSARKETSTPGSRICCFDPARPCENKFPPRVYTVFCSAQLKDHRRKSTQFRKCTAKDLRPQFMLHGHYLATLTSSDVRQFSRSRMWHTMASRTPSPEYWRPRLEGPPSTCQYWYPRLEGPPSTCQVPVFVVYVRAPQAHVSDVPPRALGSFIALTRICPSGRLQTSIDSFLGWLLEAFTMPMEQNRPLRRHLREWQLQLRGDCRYVRLRWHEAFAIYGLELELS